jgi:carbamoyl-phosphate synthase small subunit
MKKAYLVLSNGQIFEGEAIGAEGETIGEIVFTTGVVGYLETLTDPSYAGQIVVQTFPMIGNYGVIEDDFEGNCAVKGYVVREICGYPSNFRCQYDLDAFLKNHNIPGICGVDTREITRIIRESGVMNATICYSVPESLEKVKEYEIKGVVKEESTKEIYECSALGEAKYNVVLIDYGAKRNIIRCLNKRGCNVTVVPCTTSAEDILAMNPDGLMLSNGPGDPEDNEYSIAQIKKLIGKLPIFGICLGHQLTALAMGGKTIKLKYGHRGGNQPVKEVNGKRTYITSQNHGYAVVSESLKGVGEELFINANDGSCEGMNYPGLNCFTVQFHPEACSGPQDTEFLFDKFISMMGGKQNA